jgi:HNH endonuclease
MKSAWAIAPYENNEHWEEIWQFDRANNVISIGWSWLGNVIGLDENQIRGKIKTQHPEYKSKKIEHIIGQFRFLREIEVGHRILARKGLMQIRGLGVVTEIHYFDSTKAAKLNIDDYDFRNFLSVRWLEDFEPIDFKKKVFHRNAIMPVTDAKILKTVEKYFKEGVSDSEDSFQNSAIDDIPTAPIGSLTPGKMSTTGHRYQRKEEVRRFVIEQAKGTCECCRELGFLLPEGNHYLEAHHIIGLAKQGPDTVDNVIALCPSDHREAHYGKNKDQLEAEMKQIIKKRNSRSPKH